ncbi:MAG: ATP-binding protein [bacterium]|nr:ATP-binding protein [bacterium]
MNQRIFISSVQREFAKERRALAEMIRKDMLLGTFFDVFLFEEMAAQNRSAKSVYLDEVRNSDIYLGLFGCEYGFEDAEGVSPTEREYDLATECGKYRLAFVKRTAAHNRMPKERTLIAKVEREVTRKSFSSLAMLKKMVYEALFRYLQDRDVVNVRPFDGSYSLGVKLEDLDPERIANFVRMVRVAGKVTFAPGISTTEILSRLGAFDAGTGKIANAAALLFAKNPALFRPSWELKCLQLWGTTFEKPFPSYHIYHGTVFEQIDQALDFVMSRVDHWVGARDAAKSAQAPARSEFPIEAVREAIVNAVCHRDYTDDGSVQVMLFRDRLEVLNPGTLPRGWTAANLLQTHDSKPHNGILATAMQWAGYVEKSGYGTEDIVRKCKAWGLRVPEYHPSAVDFRLVLWRKEVKEPCDSTQGGGVAGERGVESSVSMGVESDEKKPVKSRGLGSTRRLIPTSLKGVESGRGVALSLREQILLLIAEKPQGSTEVARSFGFRRVYGNLARRIMTLLEDQLIEQTLPDKPNSRLQKYRITRKGRQVAKLLAKNHAAIPTQKKGAS